MQRYVPTAIIGTGKFGRVLKAHTASGETVAIKELPLAPDHAEWEDVLAVSDVRALRRLRHPNIIKLREVVRDVAAPSEWARATIADKPEKKTNVPPAARNKPDGEKPSAFVFLVMEYAARDLLGYFAHRESDDGGLSEPDIKLVMFQLLSALAHCHANGVVHRDVKPENILFVGDDLDRLKLADFGIARTIPGSSAVADATDTAAAATGAILPGDASPGTDGHSTHGYVPSERPATPYVGTRWYRAPEVCLGMPYGTAVDLWAAGAVMAALRLLRPFLAGGTTQEQLFKMCSAVGTPSPLDWSAGHHAAAKSAAEMPSMPGVPFKTSMPGTSDEFVDLLAKLLVFNPAKRITAAAALAHPFFAVAPPKPIVASRDAPELPNAAA